jgi:hypothetical protein
MSEKAVQRFVMPNFLHLHFIANHAWAHVIFKLYLLSFKLCRFP